MRDLRFRAWDEGNNKMYSPEELEQENASDVEKTIYGYLSFGSLMIFDFKNPEEPAELFPLQSTGWYDNEQKEIFEGDIVESDTGLYQIMWSEEIAGFILLGNDGSMAMGGPYMSDVFKLKGNIYQNPELLKFDMNNMENRGKADNMNK